MQKIIIIGSSTGGPIILEQIFSGVPDIPVSIIIVQHIHPFFMSDLKSHIQTQTQMQVDIPKEGEIIKHGHIYIAPAGRHLILKNNKFFSLTDTEKVNSVRPSIDITMKSIIKTYNLQIMGIILTGMGNDGTEGVKHLKSLGGTVIVQNPSTSPIRTMPLNAIETGIIDAIYNPDEIKQIIKKFGEERTYKYCL